MVHPAYEEEFLNMDHIPWQLVIRLVDNGNRRYEVDQLAREAAALLISRMVYHINATRFVKLRRSVIINQVHVQLFGRITANGINRIAEDDRFLRLGDLTGNSVWRTSFLLRYCLGPHHQCRVYNVWEREKAKTKCAPRSQ